jgi:hypothetical protein
LVQRDAFTDFWVAAWKKALGIRVAAHPLVQTPFKVGYVASLIGANCLTAAMPGEPFMSELLPHTEFIPSARSAIQLIMFRLISY